MPGITYYASNLSENIGKTDEGFLIARNVRINRTGAQDYLGQEIGLPEKFGQLVKVYRLEEDVFNPVAIASFEGKPLSDDHPPEEITPENSGSYVKGHLQNVRRGPGVEDCYTLADIIVNDANVISKIENGKREVSCGYKNKLVPYLDGYKQIDIVGNHLALVNQGRAGKDVKIRDEKPKQGDKKVTKKNILFKMLSVFAKDADPEDVEKALDAIAEKAEEKDPPEKEIKDCGCKDCKAKDEEIEKLKKESEDKKSKDAEKEGIEGLKKFVEEEEKEPEHKSEGEDKKSKDESSVLNPEKGTVNKWEGKNPITDAQVARNVALKVIKDCMPAIAAIKDPKEQKLLCDAMMKNYRTQIGKPENFSIDSYAHIQEIVDAKAKRENELRMTQDQAALNDPDRGLKIAQQHNPHYIPKK